MSTIRVRFAPSPTGDLHVGGARAALFNYLFARNRGGSFILRIEDTDAERSTPAATQGILDALRWLGLEWDEGPIFQSRRGEHYRRIIAQLAAGGHAYRCFCTKERLDDLRRQAEAEKRLFTYDRACAALPPAEAQRRADGGEIFVWRFRVPEAGVVEWDDLIRGRVSIAHQQLGDFVIARSDGSPIFYLANAADDIDTAITHVIRGEDHLTNTGRQILLIRALGHQPPQYAALPLVLGPDRAKLSKRHGADSTLVFRDKGYLPEALFNYLALVGWSLDDKAEILSREQLIENFSLERINKAAGIFDHKKLEWINGQYIRRLAPAEFAVRAIEFMQNVAGASCSRKAIEQTEQKFEPREATGDAPATTAGVQSFEVPAGQSLSPFGDYTEFAHDPQWLRGVLSLFQERVNTLAEIEAKIVYFLRDDFPVDPKAAAKFLQPAGAAKILDDCAALLRTVEPWELPALEAAFKDYCERTGTKFGALAQPLRVCLTGGTASPSIFEVIHFIGRERCLRRIRNSIRQP